MPIGLRDSTDILVGSERALSPEEASHRPRQSRWAWGAVLVAAILVFAAKPWALIQPQLWAEDGTIHLLENEAFSLNTLLHPYRGYLHTLPRLIAWTASRTSDVAHWPAFYNTAAFLVAIGLLVRMASSRLDLPEKPWLILAFVLTANTAEVFLNLTNLHWLTSFFLLAQVLIAPARSRWQFFADLALLVLIGLTGPFVLVYLPLFIWRWWRERDRYSEVVLLAAAVCAAIQLYFVLTEPLVVAAPLESLHFEKLWTALGKRLIAWPLLGPKIAMMLPDFALAVLGLGVVGLLGFAALRSHPERTRRIQVLAAFGLITFACVYRVRPDTWADPALENGDSYFFIPRVLLAWLVIWNFNAQPRIVGWMIRLLCFGGLVVNFAGYIKPTPPNFHWVLHCETIRSGQPADIPTLPEGWILRYTGRSYYAEATRGWYGPEFDAHASWRWSSGDATLRLFTYYAGPQRLSFSLRGIQAQQVTVRLGKAVIGTLQVDTHLREFTFTFPHLPLGPSELTLISDQPGKTEPTPATRKLAFALYRLSTR